MLKWLGGKSNLLSKIFACFPNNGKRLIEPFTGSAVVGLNANVQNKVMADTNMDLINLYAHVQNNLQNFVDYTKGLFASHNNTEEMFYIWRDLFNQQAWDSLERAGIFLYLNKHCFGGVCRYNASGKFNVPFGKHVTVNYFHDDILLFHEKMKDTQFLCSDFRQIFDQVTEGDIVYCDPPYLPLTITGFVNYSGDGFALNDQKDLAECARIASKKGATVIISNHDVPIVDELYKDAIIQRFGVKRFISGDGKRNNAPEVLAVFIPQLGRI